MRIQSQVAHLKKVRLYASGAVFLILSVLCFAFIVIQCANWSITDKAILFTSAVVQIVLLVSVLYWTDKRQMLLSTYILLCDDRLWFCAPKRKPLCEKLFGRVNMELFFSVKWEEISHVERHPASIVVHSIGHKPRKIGFWDYHNYDELVQSIYDKVLHDSDKASNGAAGSTRDS